MNKLFNSHHPARHVSSFKYAFKGLFHVLLNEANFRVQLFYAITIFVLGLVVKLDSVEWSLIVISLGFLLAAEMVNTVVEEFIDHLIKEYHEGARIIKDLSAGFVLTAGAVALIVTLLILVPKLVPLL